MKNKYAVQGNNEEHLAKAKVNAISISTKHCIEICSYIRKKNMQKAKELLKLAIEKKRPIPFKKFTGDVGHRKGNLASGRFPVKACTEILKLLETVEANAQFKGLNTSGLIISHICANKASTPWRYGRHIRRKGKRTNIEVVVKECAEKKEIVKKKQTPKETKVEKTRETKVSGHRKSEGFSSEAEAPKKEPIKETKPEVKKEQPVEPKQKPVRLSEVKSTSLPVGESHEPEVKK